MSIPQRIQLRRAKGWNLQELSQFINGLDAVNVARPSLCGNMFIIDKHGTRAECVAKHRTIITSGDHQEIIRLFEEVYPGDRVTRFMNVGRTRQPYIWSPGSEKADWFLCSTKPMILSLCRGRNVGCWCNLGVECHGDTLIEVANT